MTTYYKAVFANGHVLVRSTATRKCCYAYLCEGTYCFEGNKLRGFSYNGFSSSKAQAHKNMDTKTAWTRRGSYISSNTNIAEVIPAIETTKQEYQAINQAKVETAR